jgi:two-component system LytT family response regulator
MTQASVVLRVSPRDFIRIHRSAIVRLTSIAELHRESDGGGTIILAGGVRLRVARGRWEALQTALGLG